MATTNQHVLLSTEVFAEEVKKVLFSLKSNKVLGPDGLNSHFFKECSVTEPGMVTAIQYFFFFSNGNLPRLVHSSAIAIIPKKEKVKE